MTGKGNFDPANALSLAVHGLPSPFHGEKFEKYATGIYEHPEISVYMNAQRDFAFLLPMKELDYSYYAPRFARLGLKDYRKSNIIVERRFAKIAQYFTGALRVLEIGASEGTFLRYAHEKNDALSLYSLELDVETKNLRDENPWLTQYSGFDEIASAGATFSIVCFFHVLEHIMEPTSFLASCGKSLAKDGRIVVEVPALDDPLLSLYHSEPCGFCVTASFALVGKRPVFHGSRSPDHRPGRGRRILGRGGLHRGLSADRRALPQASRSDLVFPAPFRKKQTAAMR